MVEARQRSLRSFIFVTGQEEETIAYIQKHFILIKDFLLVFAYPITNKLLEFLQSQDLTFIEQKNSQKILSKLPETQKPQETSIKTESTQILPKDNQPTNQTLILHRTIRSGEEIITKGDITIFGRVNSGAMIHAQGNVQIFGEIGGNVFCNGNYMILGPIKEGNILFDGEIIEKDKLLQNYQKIYKKNNEIIIEDLL